MSLEASTVERMVSTGNNRGIREVEVSIEEHGIIEGLLPGPKRALVAFTGGIREEVSSSCI